MLSELDAEFRPDWASPPGSTISRALKRIDMSLDEFAQRLQVSKHVAENLIYGEEEISSTLADKLSSILGSTPRFWLAREHAYRGTLLRLHSKEASELASDWLAALPISDMQRFGWIKPANRASRFAECMRFFGVASIDEWKRRYESAILSVAFRTSASFDTNPAAVAAWLRIGEIRAQKINCGKWNPKLFSDSLDDARRLTRVKDPGQFLPALREICAASGVALVIARSPDGCRASGAARFLKTKQALIQLSFRHLTDDHFWFSFFHEAGHLLLHEQIGLFLDDFEGMKSIEEDEANEFAADKLLSPALREELKHVPLHHKDVIRFALKAGVSPGIIVGQLQHAGLAKRNWLNKCKRRFSWDQLDS